MTRLSAPRDYLLRITVIHGHLTALTDQHDLRDQDNARLLYEVVLGLVIAGNLAREFEQAHREFAGGFSDLVRVRDKLAHSRSYDDISAWRVVVSVRTALTEAAERAQALLDRLQP